MSASRQRTKDRRSGHNHTLLLILNVLQRTGTQPPQILVAHLVLLIHAGRIGTQTARSPTEIEIGAIIVTTVIATQPTNILSAGVLQTIHLPTLIPHRPPVSTVAVRTQTLVRCVPIITGIRHSKIPVLPCTVHCLPCVLDRKSVV